ncbi:MAG TPA: phosphoribosyltransferase family protein [Anaeromyxobacter sp.]|nr:phosphoribosyltransferase family protein [Anaeromyxobacter sp.]
MVDSGPPGRRGGRRPEAIAIATAKKRKSRAPARRSARPARRTKAAARPDPLDYPIGEGVADGFALDRLAAPARLKRAPKRAVRELGWAAFGEVARALATQIARRFRPSVVVGIAKGGVFVGGALAAALGADFYPVRIERRSRDAGALPEPIQELPDLDGKRVLVVDDVASTGATLARARALARKAGAREVRTAVLVARPRGARPDFSAFATDELILFGWDYQLDAADDPGEVGV